MIKLKYKVYICSICGCKFAVNIDDVKYAEKNGVYLTCPIHGQHKEIEFYKEIMEERSAVRV